MIKRYYNYWDRLKEGNKWKYPKSIKTFVLHYQINEYGFPYGSIADFMSMEDFKSAIGYYILFFNSNNIYVCIDSSVITIRYKDKVVKKEVYTRLEEAYSQSILYSFKLLEQIIERELKLKK